MKTAKQVRAWNWLMACVAKTPDKNMRIAMIEDFRRKAQRDWGWVPGETTATASDNMVELDAWEMDFLKRIRIAQTLNVIVGTDKRNQTLAEAQLNMREFLREGGCLNDIPENIRTKDIEDLYYQTLYQYGDELMMQAEYLQQGVNNE